MNAEREHDAMTCPTGKKCFAKREEALKFEEEVRAKYPTQAQQHAYACEQCRSFHLSALPPEADALSKTQAAIPPAASNRMAKKTEGEVEQILGLKRKGCSLQQIAEQTGFSYPTVYKYCVDAGLHVPSRTSGAPSSTAMTIEALEGQERDLQAKLQEVQRKRQRLIEAKTLKMSRYLQGLRIEKEGNVLLLDPADAEQLVERLTECLTEPQPQVAHGAEAA